MGQNRKVRQLSEGGFSLQDALDDRLYKGDGWIFWPAPECVHVGTAQWQAIRDGSAWYYLQRQAVAAETMYVNKAISLPYRLSTAKGFGIRDTVCFYRIDTVAATTITAAIGIQTATASSITTLAYPGYTYDAAHQTNAQRVATGFHALFGLFVGNIGALVQLDPPFQTDDGTTINFELEFKIPNTCLLTVYGIGAHLCHDYL